MLCNISQVKFENTTTVPQCTPTGNCDAKDLHEIIVLPYPQFVRKERLKKAHYASAVNFCLLLFWSGGIGCVCRSVRFGTVTVALSGMFGPVVFLLCHLRFLLSCKPLSFCTRNWFMCGICKRVLLLLVFWMK